MIVLSFLKAPWVVQFYRCLFIATIAYVGSLFWEYRHGSSIIGHLIIGSFPLGGLLGLIFTFIRVSWSRWVLALIGILIPAIILGAIDLGLPYQGWFDALGGVLIWCSIALVPATWAWALFKDQKTKIYFKVIDH